MTGRVSVAEISADLGARAECFCRAYFPQGHRQGSYWQVGNTSGALGRSLVIRLHAQDGRKAGGWTDYATGEFGDLIDLLHAKLGSRSLRETLHEAKQFLGNAPLPVQQVTKKVSRDAGAANARRIASARRLLAAGRPVFGTAAAAYLHRRGIAGFGPALRFHPRVYLRGDDRAPDQPCHSPALLAKITDNQANITGCARTYLEPTTGRIADLHNPKRILGQLHGNAVRFWSGSNPSDLIVGEGLENTLSVGTALSEFNLASCLTATHLGLFIPPPWIKRIWIARDNDVAGARAAQTLASKLGSSGIECRHLVPKLGDFNEDLLAFGKGGLRNVLLAAMKG
ncbi:MAG: toprim domain-containing protein [Roseibium sp.]|uniref:DUF7146 domain-containing protein n=1 Tax=Alphaproteobacteria TaxID=28211 RepID=UPI002942B498|nr:toprim domain-containing protein [Sulfitobacter sp. LC.270.F.C4]WOI13250.1 toprim domain-containing protein [Sulfitobacter sp. LC.270.F.C4]